MITVADFQSKIKTMSRDRFVQEYNHPFLLLGLKARDEDRVKYETAAPSGIEAEGEGFNFLAPLILQPQKPVITVGRSRSNTIVISEPSISKLHVMIERNGETFFIQDAGSHNGTILNGRPLTPNIKEALKDGDNIILAKNVFACFMGPRVTHAWLTESGASPGSPPRGA